MFYGTSVSGKNTNNVFPTEPKTDMQLVGEKIKIGEFKKQCHHNKHIFKYFCSPQKIRKGENQYTEKGQVLMTKKQCL